MYDKNIEFFKISPSLHRTLTEEKPLFDTVPIETEIESIDQSTKTLILFGLGHFQSIEVLRLLNLERLIIVEPSLQTFKSLLERVDIETLMEGMGSVTFVLNKTAEEASEYLNDLVKMDIAKKITVVSQYTNYDDYFNRISEILINDLRGIAINLSTRNSFCYAWPVYTFENLKQEIPLFDMPDMGAAVIVSAGPSLDKNIHLLPELKKRAFIFAVGSAIKILENHGITPHFRVAIDPTKEQEKIFDGIETEATLIHNLLVYSPIIKAYKGPKAYIVTDTEGLVNYIHNNISYKPIIAGFSVANVALDLLCKFNCKKVILMGQDLCYTEERLYAEGSWVNEKMDVTKKGYIKTSDIYGKEVYTNKIFLGMKKLFEDRIRENPGISFINATEGGLHIEGTVNMSAQQVLDNLDFILSEYNPPCDFDSEVHATKILLGVMDLRKDLERVLRMNEKVIKKLRYGANLESVKRAADKIKDQPVYMYVILPAKLEIFAAIESRFTYRGEDKAEEAKYLQRKLVGEAVEIKKYAEFILSLIRRFVGEEEFDIVIE